MSDGARCHYCRKVPCACDTAPQPPPSNPPSRYKGRCDVHGLRTCDECQYGETDAKLLAAAVARIAALEASNGNAFVDGAKWWEWQKSNATMWQPDQQAAFEEAKRRGFVFKPFMETVLEGKIAALEANLAALQQANVMARDIADQANQRADDALHQLVMTVKAADFALKSLKPISTAYRHLVEATTATAATVAQHTASVERRGALKALDKLLTTLSPDGLPWTPKYPYELHHTVENLKRAADLEGA